MSIVNSANLFNTEAAMYVIGTLMREPSILFDTDKYILSHEDFANRLYQIIFSSIYNMASDEVKSIDPMTLETYIHRFDTQYQFFVQNNGAQVVNYAYKMTENYDMSTFQHNYVWVKKMSTLRELQEQGFSISDLVHEDLLSRAESFEKLDKMSIADIIKTVRDKLQLVENHNYKAPVATGSSIAEGMRHLVDSLKVNQEVGMAMQGHIIDYACRGCRKGKMYFFSAPQGAGKTRMMVGNACGIALPYIGDDGYVHRPKKLQKTLFVATEMQRDEIQTLVLAWVSGINERKFLLNEPLTVEEQKRVAVALELIDKYQDNLTIEVITDPCVSKLKRMLTTYILERKVEYIIYDYIFTSPSLMAEFPGLREDVSLMMLSNMLKEVAATYDVFILSGSQLNGDWSKTLTRTANCLRGAKSLADKVDVGMIGVPVLPEELEHISEVVKTNPIQPNIVIDIYKNRRGEMCYCKVFRRFDHGTCRTTDLFATTQEFQPLSYGVLQRDEERVELSRYEVSI